MKKNLLIGIVIFMILQLYNITMAYDISQSYLTPKNNLNNSQFFIENKGQWDNTIKYLYKSNGNYVFLTNDGILFDSYDISINNENFCSRIGCVVKMKFEGNPNDFNFVELKQEQGLFNYFYGNNPNKWIKNAKQFSSIVLKDVYKGIDVVLNTDNGLPRYDFSIKPNADPSLIKINYLGAKHTSINSDGELVIQTPNGSITHGKILAYQNINNRRLPIDCSFQLNNNSVGFKIGKYDKTAPLVIDPTVFSSYYGGEASDSLADISITSLNEFVVCGWTESENFIFTPGAYDTLYHFQKDAFVSKFDINGENTNLVFSTFIGGTNNDEALTLDIDASDYIYFAGTTNSPDYPNVRSYGLGYTKEYDIVVTKIYPDGDELDFSSFIGGVKDEIPTAILVDATSQPYVVGYTNSTNFPTIGTCYQKTFKGVYDGFLIKLSVTGSNLEISTYFGGSADDRIYGLDLDYLGNAAVVGETYSADFPVGPYNLWGSWIMDSPYDPTFNGESDVFVAKFNANGSAFEFSSFFGGSNLDRGKAVIANDDGTVFIAGETLKETGTATFPIKENAFQANNNGGWDIFVTQISEMKKIKQWWGTQRFQDLNLSTYLGNSSNETLSKMFKNTAYNSLFIVGSTTSSTFPSTYGYESKNKGKSDAFFCSMTLLTSELPMCGLFGGLNDDFGTGLAIDKRNDIYLVGTTKSNDYKQIRPFQNGFGGGLYDGFITKIAFGDLEIQYPGGNEEFCCGTTKEIKWTANNFSAQDQFTLQLTQGLNQPWVNIAENITGFSYNWEIPCDKEYNKDYRVRVLHKSGIISDSSNTFSILKSPEITTSYSVPENLDLCEGENITFHSLATGNYLKFQWKHNDKNIDGATDSVYQIESLKSTDAGTYQLFVSGKCTPEVTSQVFTIIVKTKTAITKEPKDTLIKKDKSITFSVTAKGEDLKYEWYRNNDKILAANESSYTISSTQKIHEGKYKCLVTGTCGSTESREAILTVDTVTTFVVNPLENNQDLKLNILYDANNHNTVTASLSVLNECSGRILLYDNNGNLVDRIFEGFLNKTNNFELKTENLNSAVYWVVVETNIGTTVKKVNIVK